jgi:hypothetical protein
MKNFKQFLVDESISCSEEDFTNYLVEKEEEPLFEDAKALTEYKEVVDGTEWDVDDGEDAPQNGLLTDKEIFPILDAFRKDAVNFIKKNPLWKKTKFASSDISKFLRVSERNGAKTYGNTNQCVRDLGKLYNDFKSTFVYTRIEAYAKENNILSIYISSWARLPIDKFDYTDDKWELEHKFEEIFVDGFKKAAKKHGFILKDNNDLMHYSSSRDWTNNERSDRLGIRVHGVSTHLKGEMKVKA